MELTREASLKTDEERAHLKAKIFDEKMKMSFIRQELNLIVTDSKSRVRESVYEVFMPYIHDVISELHRQFDQDFPTWNGNLYTLSRKYEQWLKSSIGVKLLEIVDFEKPAFEKILHEVSNKFTFYTRTLKERLEGNVYKVLKLKIPAQEWKPEFRPLKRPDISVYPAFDTPIDLLWFVIPMSIFRNIFRKYFRRQISAELEKKCVPDNLPSYRDYPERN